MQCGLRQHPKTSMTMICRNCILINGAITSSWSIQWDELECVNVSPIKSASRSRFMRSEENKEHLCYFDSVRICVSLCGYKRNIYELEVHSFTQHWQEMNLHFDNRLDTNLKQFSVSRIQWKVEQQKLLILTSAVSPGRWGTCFLRWAVYRPNLFLLQLLAKLCGC